MGIRHPLRTFGFVVMADRTITSVAATAQDTTDHASHHAIILGDFALEGGTVLPHARYVYATYGHLNAARDGHSCSPATTWRTTTATIGSSARREDSTARRSPDRHRECSGDGHSSSPSNTPEPWHGPRFPITTIRDNVEAVHQALLSARLGITHLRAVIGFSNGRGTGVSVGRQLIRRSWTASWRRRAPPSAMDTASCAWRARSPRWRPTLPSWEGVTPRSRCAASAPSARCGRGGCSRRSGGEGRPGGPRLRRQLGGRSPGRHHQGLRGRGMPTTTSCKRARGNTTTSARPKGSTGMSSVPYAPLSCRCSTCPRRPICTSHSPMRSTSANSSAPWSSRRSPPLGSPRGGRRRLGHAAFIYSHVRHFFSPDIPSPRLTFVPPPPRSAWDRLPTK